MPRIAPKHLDMLAPIGNLIAGLTAAVLSGRGWMLAAALICAALAGSQAASAADQTDSRPYDERLVRLSELLGAVHYLRELCGASDGQLWRERMKDLIDSDGGSALRRTRLTKSFNTGYRSFKRSYQTCSPAAQTTLNRFLSEGQELADGLATTAQ